MSYYLLYYFIYYFTLFIWLKDAKPSHNLQFQTLEISELFKNCLFLFKTHQNIDKCISELHSEQTEEADITQITMFSFTEEIIYI